MTRRAIKNICGRYKNGVERKDNNPKLHYVHRFHRPTTTWESKPPVHSKSPTYPQACTPGSPQAPRGEVAP